MANEEKEKKIFVGSGKKRKENWLSITVNPDKLADHVQEYEGNKYVKLNVNILKEPDKYGKDIEVTIDTWKPDGSKAVAKVEQQKEEFRVPDTSDDVPF